MAPVVCVLGVRHRRGIHRAFGREWNHAASRWQHRHAARAHGVRRSAHASRVFPARERERKTGAPDHGRRRATVKAWTWSPPEAVGKPGPALGGNGRVRHGLTDAYTSV